MKITAKHKRAIAALVSGRSRVDTAAAASIGLRTLERWLADSDFRDALHTEMDAITATAGRLLLSEIEAAILKIREIMNDPEASAAVRLRAANDIIDKSAQISNLTRISERLDSLEEYYYEVGSE